MNTTHTISKELETMLIDFYSMPAEKRYTTDYWINTINNQRIAQLITSGYENFGHTLAIEYCAWYDNPTEPNISKLTSSRLDFLIRHLSKHEVANAKKLAKRIPVSPYTVKEYNLITLLIWQYVKNQGLQKESEILSESMEGNPPAIHFEGRLISQGLAHSFLEYDTIRKNAHINSIKSTMSIGPGYGRTTYVLQRLLNIQKSILVDVPPALYIAQRYLGNLLPEKKIFKYRKFTSFAKIEKEFQNAEIVFLMPWQIELLPEKCVDLILAIDSFDDNMNMKAIKKYLKYIGILGKHYFYLKCWKEWKNEDGIIKWGGEKNYPIPTNWEILVNRSCRAQTDFFETLYQLPECN
ncbi:MAG: hypothetical protein UV59_C0033G0009 [Candidatus Gottesmanbacteria bacterium GW2011_GWA1_43_11]|uniref:Sugar O-methyltransferase n=1 Tax=Candidatus Gottesmanbacteria bacterium GW2011_GWA1_43_11 TaxID=1618436 RepID=A0A0G1EL00_9BACT|nr:MAG: hypothetical protein UV59_C0033G0009 [Candidatus Gottesmanbacteria bacterium GW2011_GWA1_43_11]